MFNEFLLTVYSRFYAHICDIVNFVYNFCNNSTFDYAFAYYCPHIYNCFQNGRARILHLLFKLIMINIYIYKNTFFISCISYSHLVYRLFRLYIDKYYI